MGTKIVIVLKHLRGCYNILVPNGAESRGSKATGRVSGTREPRGGKTHQQGTSAAQGPEGEKPTETLINERQWSPPGVVPRRRGWESVIFI